jgi:hypothetical protein
MRDPYDAFMSFTNLVDVLRLLLPNLGISKRLYFQDARDFVSKFIRKKV